MFIARSEYDRGI
ncbi:hypothetical protein V502_08791, partial [Pseudogymnoascus sp. VKM F-4520 (FW-2644)]